MTTIFMAFALFFLILAALNVPSRLGLTWGWTGLSFWCLAILIILLRRYP